MADSISKRSIVNSIRSSIIRNYAIRPISLRRIYQGQGTRNWRLDASEGRFFVKEYRANAHLRDELSALELSQYALERGVPTPKVIRSRSDTLMCTEPSNPFAIFEYAQGAPPKRALSLSQMTQAGDTLGVIHSHFKEIDPTLPAETSSWLLLDLTATIGRVERYIRAIREKPSLDDFDRSTLPLLEKRKVLLRSVPSLLEAMPSLTTQVIHNDYGPPNILFKDGKLTAVVDFGPARPFLISYEIGRVAFNPETVIAGNWHEKSLALVNAYRSVNDVPIADLIYAPHIWTVQLIRSLYGVREHYDSPTELQHELDRFWFQRALAAEAILSDLPRLHAMLQSAR